MTGNYALLNSLYRENWVVQNVVGLMVDDMLREWYELKDAAPDQLKALHRAEQRAGLRRCISTGLKWGRLYGGAAGLILIAGQTDLSQPLDPDSIQPGSFRGLYILDRWQGISPEPGLTFEGGEVVPAFYSINDAAGHIVTRCITPASSGSLAENCRNWNGRRSFTGANPRWKPCTRMLWTTIMFRPTWQR